jgi:hypothetical protein
MSDFVAIIKSKAGFSTHTSNLSVHKSTVQMLGPGVSQEGGDSEYILIQLHVEYEPAPTTILASDKSGYDFMNILREAHVFPAEFQCSEGTLWVNPDAVEKSIPAPAGKSGEEQTSLVFNDGKKFVVFGTVLEVNESLKTFVRPEFEFAQCATNYTPG